MELNIITIAYLFFRLAPFIIVCYFSLSSVFNQDIKGLIYLGGLLIACTITFLSGILFPSDTNNNATKPDAMCANFTINGGTSMTTNLPLGISCLSYTFFYLLFVIVKNHLELNNLPTLIIFPILIAGDLAWNMTHSCFNIIQLFMSIIVGGSVGLLWGWAIDSINNPALMYINTGGNQTVCNRPAKQLFKCTFPNNKNKDDEETTPTPKSSDGFATMQEAYSNPDKMYQIKQDSPPVILTTAPTVKPSEPPSIGDQALNMIQTSNEVSMQVMKTMSDFSSFS